MRALTIILCVVLGSGVAAARGKHPARSPRSIGQPWKGRLEHGMPLPQKGEGYLTPATWQSRGLRFGTRLLVTMIARVAAKVASGLPGALLYVGDLSPAGGGPSSWHRSHQNGRDVDLLFFAVDKKGRPAPPPRTMRRFGKDLRSGGYRLDLARNWALIRALLREPVIVIFVHPRIERALVEWARAHKQPAALVRRAADLMQPRGDTHDDHFHVRIAAH